LVLIIKNRKIPNIGKKKRTGKGVKNREG
jgi:hypothetical protein